jgi:nucleotide-binding universal stress UspA family protein
MTSSAAAATRERPADGPAVIVVGVDGSSGSAAALDFALAEGHSRGLSVELVTAWLANPEHVGPTFSSPVEAGRALAHALQEQALAAAYSRTSVRPVVTYVVIHDHPGRVLVARAERAAMVVVGSGRHSPASLKVLGSVSEYCLRHAGAPVVVVPEPRSVELASLPPDSRVEAAAS